MRKPNAIFAAPMAAAVQPRLLIVAMLERERAATIARSISSARIPRSRSVLRPDR
jgi:hypothetical protein